MGCDCRKGRDCKDHRERQEEVFKFLEVADLRAVGEHVDAITETRISAVKYLDKAERAEQLGLGRDVATLYRQAAERDRDQAIRQFRAVIEPIDERTGRDDWADLVDRINREFEARDGAAQIEEATGRFRLAVLEMDGVSGDGAEEIVGVWEQSVNRLRADGLNGGIQLLKERLESGVEALLSPQMGREPASPRTTNQLICIGIFSAMATVMMAICGFTPFCWCCGGYAIIIWLALMIAGCLLGP